MKRSGIKVEAARRVSGAVNTAENKKSLPFKASETSPDSIQENSYRQMLELSPVPIFIYGDGRFIYANKEAVRLHGFHSPVELLGAPLSDFVHPDDASNFARFFLEDGGCEDKERRIEMRIVRPDEKVLDVEIVSVPVIFEGAKARLAVCTDRTEKKRAKNALLDHLFFMETLIDTIPSPIFYKDASGKYIGCNKRFAEKILGLPRREIMGKSVFEFPDKIPREFAEIYHEQDLKLLKNPGIQVYESRARCASGAVRDFIFYKAAYYGVDEGDVAGLVGIMVDITELRKAEKHLYKYQEKLWGLTNSVTLSEELERRRIAEDLHERIGQTLSVSKMKLGVLRQSITTSELAEELDEIRYLISQTIQDARSLTFELSPPVLHEVGIKAALEWFLEQFNAQSEIDFIFRDDGRVLFLEDNIRVFLFRVVRELLFNVTTHSEARKCAVQIEEKDGIVRIRVEDDGVGFDVSKVDEITNISSGFGLFSIRERMKHLGGRLEIDSAPGKGTSIIIVSPTKYERRGRD